MYVTQKDNGTISPNSVSLNFGQNQTFTFTPNVGYKIESIRIDGENIPVTAAEGESQTYTFTNVQTDHTIEVNYAIRTFWLNVTQSSNGNISPASVIKNYNTTERFYIYPHTGYKLVELIIDGVSQPIENNNGEEYEYTFIGIQTNHSISARFEIRKFTVTFVGDNGDILSTQTINFGSGAIAPETLTSPEGHHFTGWDKNFNHIYNDTIILAQFEINRYEVTFLDWNDEQLYCDSYIAYGDDAEYIWSLPTREGYRFDGWDGDLTNITANKTVKAQYVQQFKVNVTYNYPLYSESSTTLLDINTNKSFTFTPNNYFMIESISINGEVENIENTEFSEVLQDHKYLTGNSLTRTIENIQNDYNIIINLRIGPGIAESGWTYEIINEKYYITETPDLRANGNNIKWGTIIPSKLYIENAIYDVYGIGNGIIRINILNSYNNLNAGIIVIDDGIVTINNSAFLGFGDYNAVKITSVILPNSILNIGQDAFYNCTNLTSITFAEESQLTSIGYYAFEGCTSLTSIIIPNSVTSIGYGAFSGCSGLTSITIPNSVTSIESSAFANCTSLTSITFAEESQLTSIAEGVFSGCSSLTSITIPDSVISIGDYAFNGCSRLTSINVDEDNESYSSLDGVLFNKNKTTLLCYSQGKEGSYTIPEGVTSIESYAFRACSSLTSITIPSSVESIGNSAFYGCSSLETVNFGENSALEVIESYAFYECSSLTSITIPNSVTSIGGRAFRDCTSLTSIIIPEGVTSIGVSAFAGCSSLMSVEIPDSLRYIGNSAFEGCSNLTSITIPDSVRSIEESAFYGCSSLTEINVVAENSYYSSLDGVLFNKSKSSLLFYPNAKINVDYIIPSSVIYIGSYAFSGCSALTSVIFEENSQLTNIGESAFSNCSSLVSLTIPEGVQAIGNNTFYGCSSLLL
jgi:uncharacterized repeat protein (TIGR02543 family)